jgi:hypothetical protein
MTDFSPNRPHRWPASSVKPFAVYHVGDTEANIPEGQDFPRLWGLTFHYPHRGVRRNASSYTGRRAECDGEIAR